MLHNRLEEILGSETVATMTEPIAETGFMIIPAALLAPCAIPSSSWRLHQWAFERAQAILNPSWIDRDVLGVWN